MIKEPKKLTTQERPTILIIDDDSGTCRTLSYILEEKGYLPSSVGNGKDAVKAVQNGFVNLALIDLKLPDIQGLYVLEKIKELSPDTEAVIITGHASVDTAVQAMHDAAFSYVTKPIDMEYLFAIIARALEKQKLQIERKQNEEELREEKEFSDTLLQNTPFGIMLINSKKRIIEINRAALDILGREKKDVFGKICHEFICPAEKDECPIFDRGEEINNSERSVLNLKGDTIPILKSVVPIKVKGETCLLETFLDISERKKLEAQLLQAQKMEAVGTLAGGIAHDLNNILQVISGYAQLLMLKKDTNDCNYDMLEAIGHSTRRAAELTTQLLTFSRKVKSKLRPVDLNHEVSQVSKLLQRTIPKMISIETHLADDLKIINADPSQLEQIMMNLGVNAKDAMSDGGKLIFQTENVTLDEKYCNAFEIRPGDYVLLSVLDTGFGMDRETIKHIFEPFYTTKRRGKGTGLGLSMVYGIVKNHGGHITCYSEPNQGSIFRIYFPMLGAESTEQKAESKKEEIVGGNETILMVDDDEILLNLGQDMLGEYGYTTVAAETGEKAVELYKAQKDQIDLVLLDISMPGMGGHKCLRELLKINPNARIVIATGYAVTGKVKELLDSGAKDYIGKPYQLKDLLKKLRGVLDKKK
ncbi:MAG: response regulator [Deltaproteobacteria bacterium]|nr:response regulator [Deltaproteobacteria bacterium]MBW2661365.1 response regulator [Deltaproteobacteria bacterium]